MTIHVNEMQLQKIAKAIPLMACTQIAKEMNISVNKIRSIKRQIILPLKTKKEEELFVKYKSLLHSDVIMEKDIKAYLLDLDSLKLSKNN